VNKQLILLIGLAVVGLLVAGSGGQPVAAEKPASPGAQEGNLIQNPGFEGSYHAWSSIPEIQVAANWTPWWYENPGHNPAYFRPEYKRAMASVFPKRVLSGDSAQQWFTFHASHLAGMYQQVSGVSSGQNYRFSIWTQVWSSNDDNPHQSVLPANPRLQIGIDPTGNWDPGSPAVIWSGEAPMAGIIDQWGMMAVEVIAENSTVTVFMRTNPDFANKHNDMYWDQASLQAVQPPQPTLAPTSTPGPATNTPVATSTPIATNTPAATETATRPPTRTATPSPPPATAEAKATGIAMPTSTLVPTNTRKSTATPQATEILATSPSTKTRETIASVDILSTGEPGNGSSSEPMPGKSGTDGQQNGADQQTGNELSSPDSLSIVALAGIGLAIFLLLVLIYVLAKGLRRQ
jgi:hypothetical protein